MKLDELSDEYRINEFLSVKFEHGRTNIYVDGERFTSCKYLLLNVDLKEVEKYDRFDSLDEVIEELDHNMENDSSRIKPEVEYWGHCSNLQAWVDHDYNTRLLEKRLAFPLLKRLTEADDEKAGKVFSREIRERVEAGARKGYDNVINYLMVQGYLKYLSKADVVKLINTDSKKVQTVTFNNCLERLLKLTPAEKSCLDWKRLELEELKAYHYNLHKIPSILKKVTGLRTLNLAHNKIKEIKGLCNLRELRNLYLGDNRITEIKNLNGLKELKRLIVWGNRISELENLHELTSLRTLDVSYNNISEIKGLNELTNLKELNLFRNNISRIECLENLGELRRLRLYQNEINDINGLEGLNKLELLDLSGNNISELTGLEELTSLETLYLKSNNITTVDELTKLESLKRLDLRSNRVDYESEAIKSLEQAGVKNTRRGGRGRCDSNKL